jgi:hypothetical protein
VGYLSEEVPVDNDNLKVELLANVESLDEVVVVGYGTQKKSMVTGAVSRLTSDEINNRPPEWVEQAIQGKTAGNVITRNSDSPGKQTLEKTKEDGSLQTKDLSKQIDSIRNILRVNEHEKASRIALIRMYLEINSQSDALRELDNLQSQTTDDNQLKINREIIQYTREGKYSKALQRLKEIK